jgi:hypothetical protein
MARESYGVILFEYNDRQQVIDTTTKHSKNNKETVAEILDTFVALPNIAIAKNLSNGQAKKLAEELSKVGAMVEIVDFGSPVDGN